MVEFYNNGGVDSPGRDMLLGRQRMTPQDMKALAAFLRTLTAENVGELAKLARAQHLE